MPLVAVTLKNRADIVAVQGSRLRAHTPYFTLCALPDSHHGEAFFVAYTVTRKVGNAVVRNRIRRRLRAALHENLKDMCHPDVRCVFLAKGAALTAPYSDLKQCLREALHRLQKQARRALSAADQKD
jgi:ribonuclease P protein component